MEAQAITAVVTGAGGGLGRVLVDQLLTQNASVIAVDRRFGAPSNTTENRIVADLATSDGVANSIGEIRAHTSHVDLLINCAGVFAPDVIADRAWTDISHLLTHNLTGVVIFTLELEDLLRRGLSPSVVNIGSTDGVVASAGQECEIGVAHDLFYAMSKGAVITFTRALAMKWSRIGIRVNVICPTVFPSPMTESLLAEPGKAEHLRSHIPLGRLATAADVAEAALLLHRLAFTTGHLLPVDGGYLCQ